MGHELGCCGYDELAYKPPTTKPIGRGKIRAAVVNFNNSRNAIPVRQIGRPLPPAPIYSLGNVAMSGYWTCPECARLGWTCEDLGPSTDHHYGMARNRGRVPQCIRHPGVAMVLSA